LNTYLVYNSLVPKLTAHVEARYVIDSRRFVTILLPVLLSVIVSMARECSILSV